MSSVLDEIDHLPESWDVGGLIPSEFKLDKEKAKSNVLITYADEAKLDEMESGEPGKDELELDSDFTFVRKNIRSALEVSSSVLTDAVTLAQSSDSPRAFEVVAILMKAIGDTNGALLKIHEKRETIREKRGVPAPGIAQNTQNNYFVGSPAELNRLLNENK